MTYLTYHSWRRDVWKEFDSFPHGVVKYWRESPSEYRERYGKIPLLIFKVSDDHRTITLIPEEEWPT